MTVPVCYCHCSVTKVTGITASMLRSERPFSFVFPHFIDWIVTTTKYVSEATDTPHGIIIIIQF